jgi:hypothetical protein
VFLYFFRGYFFSPRGAVNQNSGALSHEKNDSHNDNDCHNADQIKRKIGIAAFGNVCSTSQATCATGISVLHKQQEHKASQTTR